MNKTAIEWTEVTWNPVTGCDKVSEGCKNCYALRLAERFRGVTDHPYEQGFDLRLWPERLMQPLHWKLPRTVFVNSMSDLFHEQIPEAFIHRVFAVMQEASRHRFQILTKRHLRLASMAPDLPWPSNIWMGVSIENQRWLERVDALKNTPAAVKFLSCEPLLGPLTIDLQGIDWVIVGGESGPGARSMESDWVTSIRDQCLKARVPFFFKQWGEFDSVGIRRGKKRAGRILDGRTWDNMPEVISMDNSNEGTQSFGGDWTREKLKILGEYLDSYTTALKNQDFRISYIDAFTGTGTVEIRQNSDSNQREFLSGSAKIAYGVKDRRFDKLVFIEKNKGKAEALKTQFGDQSRIDVRVNDANTELQSICSMGTPEFWQKNRAVVFLDPFALEVEWATVEAISKIPAFDVWILFPVGAIRRMIPINKLPSEVDPKWELKLNSVFGDDSWREMYQTIPTLYGDQLESISGTDPISELYKDKLRTVFPGVAPQSATLRNSGRSLFEFIFAISNPNRKAQGAALRIASHILDHI